jgi:hypothetical protein
MDLTAAQRDRADGLAALTSKVIGRPGQANSAPGVE